MRIDAHQHLWTDGLYAALAARTSAPRLTRRAGGWTLELAGEPPFPLPAEPQDPARRAAVLEDLCVDAAIVSLSAALGVETLPDDEARTLLAAWDADADALPGRLPAWGSVALAQPDPADIDAHLNHGRVGVTLPATALANPQALDRVGPLLERLEQRGAPLFIHPGPAQPGTWLPALTAYVAALADAWHVWALHGRARHPRLTVLFAALAGLAPLHAERLDARVDGAVARRALRDPLTFYDTSTYGPVAVESVVRATGQGALVHGSDWPYAEARPPEQPLRRAVLEENPAALLQSVPAVVAV